MVENVERHLHMGKSPFQAAKDAARELVGPIIAMTITLAAVYAPVGIQGGLTGALFRELHYPCGCRDHFRNSGADADADDGVQAAARGDTGTRFCGLVNRRFENVRNTYSRILCGTLQYRRWFLFSGRLSSC